VTAYLLRNLRNLVTDGTYTHCYGYAPITSRLSLGSCHSVLVTRFLSLGSLSLGSFFATIASTAPVIGLFGTVVGILNAFQQIATQKTSGIGAVASGIPEALVTTAFGLLVAAPAVITFNHFTGKVEALDVEIDDSSKEIVADFVSRGRPQER
jgi:MotA/TolQ/ExbB proton channel family